MKRWVGSAKEWTQLDAHGQLESTLPSSLTVLLDLITLMKLTNVSKHLLARLNAPAPLVVSQQGLERVVALI